MEKKVIWEKKEKTEKKYDFLILNIHFLQYLL